MVELGKKEVKISKTGLLLKRLSYDKQFYYLLFPGILVTFLFKYLPMGGLVIAFQDFNIFKGFFQSPWVGFANFADVFSSPDFWRIFRNTILISLYKLVFGFPVPIILALMLNELKNKFFKRSFQTVIYLPHFISWVVIAGIMLSIFSPNGGAINDIVTFFGGTPSDQSIMTQTHSFRAVLVISEIWKECGWGTIIYLAAISTIDQNLYEAAIVDGASKLRQLWHVTLPCISGVIIILLILNIGSLMEAGFDQILVLMNDLVREVSEIFDTYVYIKGISQGSYSFTTAVNLFKSVISLILILGADRIAKIQGEEGLF